MPAVGRPNGYIVTASIDGKPYRPVATVVDMRISFAVRPTAQTVRVRVAAIERYGRGPQSSVAVVGSR